MTVTIEVPSTIPFEALKAALAHIKTLSVVHVQTDNLHLKVDMVSAYPHDIYEAGRFVQFAFGFYLMEYARRSDEEIGIHKD